jgi:subtilisin family serine protease
VIAGIDWVTGNHAAGQSAVANMSLGGGASTSVDAAVSNMIADGVATAVAAGNGNRGGRQQDACKYSPARVATAMTIGATDSTDRKATWSNYGNCVDWFAPGVSILSSWSTSNTATNTISGTSMATPHTAGVAALYLQSNAGASPATVRDALYANTTKGVVTSSSTANNHLLFTDY